VATPAGPRPVRALAIILLGVIALYTWMLVSRTTSPKLGLDLQGGTSVTLVPRAQPGNEGAISADSIKQAVEIIRLRVNSLGVAESEVSTQGSGANSTIVISVPGLNQGSIVELVGQTARLTFRPVIAVAGPAPIAPVPSPSPSASGSPSPSASGSPSASATPKASSAPSPSPTPTGAGRPATGLTAAGTSPSASPSTSPSPSPSPSASPSAPPTVTPEITKAFEELDCTKPFAQGERPIDDPKKLLVTCSRDGTEKYLLSTVAVEGARISGATSGLDPQQLQGWAVNLTFDGQGTREFGDVTRQLLSQPDPTNRFAIVLDGVVVSAPVVQAAIVDGRAQITGSFTQQEAADLANVLKFGALPLAFETGEIQTISPLLGRDQLRAGIFAGLLGLALVALYSMLYYRGLGIISVLSLAVAALLTFGLLVLLGKSIGYTLTLAGIAGAIVAIGITADSFIVFFERIRDEMRDGRTLRVAVETGWVRARRTILAADAVSLIAAVILYWLSVGGVRGFAFTLGLTTIIDVAVVFMFTKPLLTLFARTAFFGRGHRLSGVDPRRLRVQPAPAPKEA